MAPIEAYCGLKSEHGKSVPHIAARLVTKLDIPRELIAEYRARCVQAGAMHIQGAFRSLEIDWQNGRPVPGLGQAPKRGAAFPYTARQMRPFAPSTAARRQGGLGKAAAARTALPTGKHTTAFLRRMERVLIDDTRVDIIATDDLTGRPVELRSIFCMDLGPRPAACSCAPATSPSSATASSSTWLPSRGCASGRPIPSSATSPG